MSSILVTGSTDGIGLETARQLLDRGHVVVAHARNDRRADDVRTALPGLRDVVVGDLTSLASTRRLAEAAAAAGPFDAVIHNAGVGGAPEREQTEDGLERIFQVNVVAPYLLTALVPRPARLVYLTSGLESSGRAALDDLQHESRPWNGMQAYSDSKLYDVLLAFAVARRWPDVLSTAVDPGWIKMPLRELGRTGLDVTSVCIGGGPVGSMPDNFGYEVPAERGVATVRRALAGPFTFLDTSNGYGDGESERRFGAALRAAGGLPAGFVLSTKVDPDPRTGDFSGARVRRSVEESRERLGLDRLQLLYLHDPERISFEEAMARGGPVEALVRLREEGVAEHTGVGGGPVRLMSRYLATGAFEVLLTHNRWTLVDRSADELIDEAVGRGMGVVNGAPFGGGILAKGSAAMPTYAYAPAATAVLDRVRDMERACAEHSVPLAAAALQFSTRDPRIASTVVGVSRPERIEQTLALATWPIPDALWEVLVPLHAPADLWQW